MEQIAGGGRSRAFEGMLIALALVGVGGLLAVGTLWVIAPARFGADGLVHGVFRAAVITAGAGAGLAALLRRNLAGAGLGALAALAALLPGEFAHYALPVALGAIAAASWPSRASGLERA